MIVWVLGGFPIFLIQLCNYEPLVSSLIALIFAPMYVLMGWFLVELVTGRQISD